MPPLQILPLSVAQQIEPACNHFLHKPEKEKHTSHSRKRSPNLTQAEKQRKERQKKKV